MLKEKTVRERDNETFEEEPKRKKRIRTEGEKKKGRRNRRKNRREKPTVIERETTETKHKKTKAGVLTGKLREREGKREGRKGTKGEPAGGRSTAALLLGFTVTATATPPSTAICITASSTDRDPPPQVLNPAPL